MFLTFVVVSIACGAAGAWAYRKYSQAKLKAEIAKAEAEAIEKVNAIRNTLHDVVIAARREESKVGAEAKHVLTAVEAEVQKIFWRK